MKQHSQASSQHQKASTIKSCEPIIQEDIINSKGKTQKFVRVAKSQQNLIEANRWQQLDSKQKEGYIQDTNLNLGIRRKPISDIKNVGTDFPIETVQSQQIQFDGESYKSNSLKDKASNLKNQKQHQIQNHLENKQLNQSKQGQLEPQLNILVCGGQDVGKTTFIQCFFNNSRKNTQKVIKQKTKQLTIISDLGIKYQDEYNIKNRIDFIDFPGFKREQQLSAYINKIWEYAFQKSEKYRKLKSLNKQKRCKEQRIHCCLYFIQGPRIKQVDSKAMKQIGKIFNLIPIIAKSDSYTIKQIKEIKQTFHQIRISNQLNFYDIKEFLVQKYPEKVKDIQNGPFEKAPPFVISASIQTNKFRGDQEQKHIRQYKWGVCEIQNQNHSDFLLLKQLITHNLRKNLIQSTKKIAPQLVLQEKMKDGQNKKSNCLLGSIFALTTTAAVVFAAYKFGVYKGK